MAEDNALDDAIRELAAAHDRGKLDLTAFIRVRAALGSSSEKMFLIKDLARAPVG